MRWWKPSWLKRRRSARYCSCASTRPCWKLLRASRPSTCPSVAPWTGFDRQNYRVSDYSAYFRLIREWLQTAVADGGRSETYPEPNPHCDVCPWDEACREQRRQDDHLSLVAGISRLQREELLLQGITTMTDLAAEPLPLRWQPGRGATETYERLREQARVQVADRQSTTPVFEPLEPEPGAGLGALPEPSDGDIFLDFEGAPSFGPGGFEYLIGYIAIEPSGERQFTALWDSTTPRRSATSSGSSTWSWIDGNGTRPAHLSLRALRAGGDEAADGPTRDPRVRGRQDAPRRLVR